MSPVKSIGLKNFTGRKEFIEKALHSLEQSGPLLIVDDTRGIQGIGKTTFLSKLYQSINEKGRYKAVWLDMTEMGLAEGAEDHHSLAEDEQSVQSLVHNVYDYRRFLLAMAQELGVDGGQPFAGFEADVDALFSQATKDLLARTVNVDVKNVTLRGGDVHIGMFGKLVGGQVKSGDLKLEVPVSDEALCPTDGAVEMAVAGLQQAITAEFVERLNASAGPRRLVVIVDNYQGVLRQPMGEWVRTGLLPELRNIVIVLGRMPSDRRLYDAEELIVPLPLDNFSRDEVEEYVRKRLGLLPPPDGLVDRIHKFSGGHPQVVSLAVDLAVEIGLDHKGLLEVFANLPPAHKDQLAKLVKMIAADIEDENTRRALKIGWVLRRFDGDLLHFLMSDAAEPAEGEVPAEYTDIITRLEQYSFTEYHPGDSQRNLPEYWKFHDFIREQIETEQMKNSRDAVEQLHRRAAAYYAVKLRECEEEQRAGPGGASEYLCWYNYENPAWQSLKGEWLYHLSRVPNRNAARLAFARAYFDAFWWWGCYRQFPFCDELLKDWRETQTKKDDQDWIKLLIEFQQHYPTGYEKYGRGNWVEVEEILVSVEDSLQLKRNVEKLNEEEQHTRAMLDLFLAHSIRYRDRNDSEADRYYAEALAIFEKQEDHWNQGWTLYEQGDLAMERGQSRQALDRAARALELANLETVQDRELMANCYRVRADVAWLEDRLDDAFADYSAAMFYAYAFQAYPHPPDFYTVDFLKEMHERTRARLAELVQTGKQEAAVRACEQMEQFWAPYWQAAGPRPQGPGLAELIASGWLDALAVRLFPPLPVDDDLGNLGSRYVRRVSLLYDRLRELIGRT